jgi:hypothetical protein
MAREICAADIIWTFPAVPRARSVQRRLHGSLAACYNSPILLPSDVLPCTVTDADDPRRDHDGVSEREGDIRYPHQALHLPLSDRACIISPCVLP